MAEVTNPSGIVVEVLVGIEKGDRDDVCGVVVEEDTLLHLRRIRSRLMGTRRPQLGVFGSLMGLSIVALIFLNSHA